MTVGGKTCLRAELTLKTPHTRFQQIWTALTGCALSSWLLAIFKNPAMPYMQDDIKGLILKSKQLNGTM